MRHAQTAVDRYQGYMPLLRSTHPAGDRAEYEDNIHILRAE